jgi:hypothetical protein
MKKYTKKYTKKHNKNTRKTRKQYGGANSLICSPYVSDKKVSNSTCYTVELLDIIRKEYNKSHTPSEYIPWSNPTTIWKTLNSRLVNCEKEDCWLKVIKDSELRNNIQNIVFAPKQPPEWKKDKNTWLTDLDIRNVMKQYEKTYPEFKFIGPSPIDFDTKIQEFTSESLCVWEELCNIDIGKLYSKGITKLGMVFNLDAHDMPGSHWVSLFVDLKPNDGHSPFVMYFDSVGNNVPKEINSLIKKIMHQSRKNHIYMQKIISHREHQKSNTECGMYSLFFNITMLTGESELLKNKSTKGKIHLFTKENIPDKYVEFYRNKYYNA